MSAGGYYGFADYVDRSSVDVFVEMNTTVSEWIPTANADVVMNAAPESVFSDPLALHAWALLKSSGWRRSPLVATLSRFSARFCSGGGTG